jgi:hypothetical protein
MNLENKVMRGNVFYFHSVQKETSFLVIKFLGNPNSPTVVRTLTFLGIQNYKQIWYEPDEESIEMLIGLHEDPKEPGVNYMLHTDQREIWFYTEAEPLVEDVAPTAA